MAKKRRHAGGAIHNGRWEPDEPTRMLIRTYIRARLIQARAALGTAKAAHDRMKTEQSAGVVEYWDRIVGYLAQDFVRKGHSVAAADWAEAEGDVLREKAVGTADRPDQPRITGME